MRKVLLFLLLSTLCATAAHVQFALEDFTTQPVLNRWFMIKPLSAPGASGSTIVGQGPIYTNISAGTIIVSNMLAGTYYCVIDTEFEQTKFRITIPSTNILINASDYLSTSTAIAPGTVAYSIAASDGRFVPIYSGSSSNQTLNNPTVLLSGGQTNILQNTNGTVGQVMTKGPLGWYPAAATGGGSVSNITNGINRGTALSSLSSSGGEQFGAGANAASSSATAVGNGAIATGNFSMALGRQAEADQLNDVAIGAAANASGTNALAVGTSATAVSINGTAVGANSAANFANSTALGAGAIASGVNDMRLGTSTTKISIPGLVQVLDANGNVIGTNSFDGRWMSTNDIYSALQTTDNTTNNIYTFTPRNNSCVRVSIEAVAWNSTAAASYGRIYTFKNNGGTVTQIGSTATLGLVEEDSAYECISDISANVVRVRVAGNTAKTVNWKVYITLRYSE